MVVSSIHSVFRVMLVGGGRKNAPGGEEEGVRDRIPGLLIRRVTTFEPLHSYDVI